MRRLALGLASLLALGGIALSQTIGTFNLTGNEVVMAEQGGPGGTGLFVPVYVMRSGANHRLVPTGTTVSTQVAVTDEVILATGAITTWNVTFPTAPYSGEKVIINCPGGTVSTLTIAATLPSGVALVGTNPTSCTSGAAAGSGWIYSVSANTWYRYQ